MWQVTTTYWNTFPESKPIVIHSVYRAIEARKNPKRRRRKTRTIPCKLIKAGFWMSTSFDWRHQNGSTMHCIDFAVGASLHRLIFLRAWNSWLIETVCWVTTTRKLFFHASSPLLWAQTWSIIWQHHWVKPLVSLTSKSHTAVGTQKLPISFFSH